jgi:DNA mismatch repair protein MLH1
VEIDEDLIAEAEKAWDQRAWTIEHVLFPALKLFLKPSKQMATDGTAIQVKKLNK